MNDDRQSNHLIREFKRLDGGSNYISASSLNLIAFFVFTIIATLSYSTFQ